MIHKHLSLLALSGLLALAAGSVQAADNSALLDALVRKGVLTSKEAEQIGAEAVKESAGLSAGKIQIGDWVKELKIGGDLRLRYQYDDATPQLPYSTNVDQRSRWRFRLRLNADFKLANNFFGGIQLQTNQAADSGNQTYTQGYDNYGIFISRAFLGWNAAPGLTFIAGKQANPFYTTDLFWDPDVNPQGLVERIDFHKFFNMTFGESGYSKEGKAPVPAPPPEEKNALEISLIAGQFIFFDNNEFNSSTLTKQDSYQFETQLLTRLKLGSKLAITVAPALFITNSANAGTAGDPSLTLLNEKAFNGQGTEKDLFILLAPGDITYKVSNIPITLYWDFAYNFQGNDRFNDVYGTRSGNGPLSADFTQIRPNVFTFSNPWHPSVSDNMAWLVGLKIGQNKKQGDWMIFGDYRQVGISSIDPNLNDSDFALSNLNVQGFKFGLAYNITDFLTAAVTGFVTWNLTENMYGGAANSGTNRSAGIARDNAVNTLQVDLQMKF